MRTTIIKDPLLNVRVKLVYGTPLEGAMVYFSTDSPRDCSIFEEQKYGLYLRLINYEKDPDEVQFMIWIRKDTEDPILGLVYGVTEYIEDACRPLLTNYGEESLSEETDAYYKESMFLKTICWLSSIVELPGVRNTTFEFQDEFSPTNTGYFFNTPESIVNIKGKGTTGGVFYCPNPEDRRYRILISNNYLEKPLRFWSILYHEIVHLGQSKYDFNDSIEGTTNSVIIAELTLKQFKLYYDRIVGKA